MASFSFIFVPFKRKLYSEIRARIVGVEGEHTDHLTTTTDHARLSGLNDTWYLSISSSV